MEDKFEWTDELVLDYIGYSGLDWGNSNVRPLFEQMMKNFKASKQVSVKKEWEILSFVGKYKTISDIEFDRNSNDRFEANLPFSYEFTEDEIIENGAKITSVKRLRDGVIFSIGDKACSSDYKRFEKEPINKFVIVGDNTMVAEFYTFRHPLNAIEHAKQPLFVTEDGKEIFEGETFYEVSLNKWYVMAESVLHKPPYDKYYKYFSTKEKAEEYILLNKPMLSLNDLLSMWGDEEGRSFGRYLDAPLFLKFKELAKKKLNQ